MQVAIVGLAPSTHDQAPLEDPDWETWGFALDDESYPYLDKVFEMHPLSLMRKVKPFLERRMREEIDVPVYMQEAYPEIPGAIAYPIEDVISIVGDYFNSSIAYMLGLAILKKVDRIGIWGVDMAGDDEYAYQRPNTEYFIGFAKGRGIDIYIPEESALLTFGAEGGGEHTNLGMDRYGYY